MQINPDMVVGESSDDESDLDAKFRLEGIHFQTTAHELTSALKTLSWKAKAIRAMGASSWLVLADAAPKCRSFSLNGQLVVVKDMVPRVPLAQFVVSKPLHVPKNPVEHPLHPLHRKVPCLAGWTKLRLGWMKRFRRWLKNRCMRAT